MKVEDIITPEEDPSGKLAEFAANLKFEDIPEENVEFVKKDVLDALACMLAGTSGPTVPAIVDLTRKWSGKNEGKGRVVVYGDHMPVPFAAIANGTIARCRDLGDTHNHGGHIVEWVIPTLMTALSADDAKKSGKDFITAFVAGAEWGARQHVTCQLQLHTNRTPGEVAGTFYTSVALAKFKGLNREQIWNTAGLMYGLHPQLEQQKYNEGLPMVRLQHGFISGDAFKCVDMALAGIEGTHGIYMGMGGLLKNIPHELESPDLLTVDLGKRWVWREEVTMKPFAGCKYNHTPICGMFNLMKEHNFTWQDIESAHFNITRGARCTVEPADVKWNPQTPAEAMFSNPYSVAYALITGDCFLDAYDDEMIHKRMADPAFVELMGRLHYSVDEDLSRPPFDDYPIEVTLKDGRKFSKVEDMLPGNVKNPMSWEQIEHKFWNCTKYAAVDLGKEKYEKIIALCKKLDTLEDTHELLEAMLP